MATKCEIRYANDQAAVFYAGSTVIGYVELTLAKSKKILGKFLYCFLFLLHKNKL